MKQVEDHPVEDMFGLEIWPGEVYYKFGTDIVLEQNLQRYLIEVQQVTCFRAIKE